MSLWFLALLLVLSAGIAIGLMLVVRRHSPATGFFGYSEFFSQDADRRDGRRGRLSAGESVVPPFPWVVLLIGAVAVSGLALFLTNPQDPKFVHAVMMAGLAVMLVAGLPGCRRFST